jgi:acetoacetate decarboxylase
MAKLRYVRSSEQVKAIAEAAPDLLDNTVRSIRCVYETDTAIARALVPRPLEPAARPEISVTFSEVCIHLSKDFSFEIGSAILGVNALYDGQPGSCLITMAMTTEQAVVGGRERYGEPKKIAQNEFERDGERVRSSVSRMGIPYLEVEGRLGEPLGPREFDEHAYCFKALPSCDAGKALDWDPLLIQLTWRHKHDHVWRVEDSALTLRESPFDPVVDIPVRRLVRCEYEEGTSQSDGRVLRSVPADWLLPFLHQRYDETSGIGIDVG